MTVPAAPRLEALVDALAAGLLEREVPVRLALLGALAGEHLLLIGPPGTAKSELARRLHRAFADAPYFERLLTRFSTPEELFGPLSLKALEADRYERLTAGFLPTAGIAFLDEVFKANSAILNTLLTLLNERLFDNGSGRVAVPLISVVGATNELPADDALAAFFDRFLLRVPVAPVSDAAFAALLRLDPAAAPAMPAPLQRTERQAWAREAADLLLGDDVLTACAALRHWLAERGQSLSDRRWRQCIGLMRMAAATEGRPAVDALDLWLAPYVAAVDTSRMPDQVQALSDWVDAELVHAVPQDAPWLTHAVEAFEAQLQLEQTARDEQLDDGSAGKLALARAIAGGHEDLEGGAPRLVSAALADSQRRRYSRVHVAARVAQMDELIAHATAERDTVAAQAADLAQRLAGRVWLPPSFADRWRAAHQHTLSVLEGLLHRARAAQGGFAGLPLQTGEIEPDEAAAASATPAPVAWARP